MKDIEVRAIAKRIGETDAEFKARFVRWLMLDPECSKERAEEIANPPIVCLDNS